MAAPRFGLIFAATLVCGACLSGCRTPLPVSPGATSRAGSVGMQLAPPPPGAAEMELPDTQRFVFPRQLDPVALPAYPSHLLQRALDAVEVCVEIDIGADGRVTQARMTPGGDCGDARADAAFGQAALHAVRQWRFEAAMLCTAPDTAYADACLHPDMTESPTAVRLSYAFRFSQREGQAVVEQVGDYRDESSTR